MDSKSVGRFKQGGGTNVADRRQTDHATEKRVATGGIACAGRAIYTFLRLLVSRVFIVVTYCFYIRLIILYLIFTKRVCNYIHFNSFCSYVVGNGQP